MIQSVPFKEATNGTLSDTNLELPSEEKDLEVLRIDIQEVRVLLRDIESHIQRLYVALKACLRPFHLFEDAERRLRLGLWSPSWPYASSAVHYRRHQSGLED